MCVDIVLLKSYIVIPFICMALEVLPRTKGNSFYVHSPSSTQTYYSFECPHGWTLGDSRSIWGVSEERYRHYCYRISEQVATFIEQYDRCEAADSILTGLHARWEYDVVKKVYQASGARSDICNQEHMQVVNVADQRYSHCRIFIAWVSGLYMEQKTKASWLDKGSVFGHGYQFDYDNKTWCATENFHLPILQKVGTFGSPGSAFAYLSASPYCDYKWRAVYAVSSNISSAKSVLAWGVCKRVYVFPRPAVLDASVFKWLFVASASLGTDLLIIVVLCLTRAASMAWESLRNLDTESVIDYQRRKHVNRMPKIDVKPILKQESGQSHTTSHVTIAESHQPHHGKQPLKIPHVQSLSSSSTSSPISKLSTSSSDESARGRLSPRHDDMMAAVLGIGAKTSRTHSLSLEKDTSSSEEKSVLSQT